jgi:hypothetical protein
MSLRAAGDLNIINRRRGNLEKGLKTARLLRRFASRNDSIYFLDTYLSGQIIKET